MAKFEDESRGGSRVAVADGVCFSLDSMFEPDRPVLLSFPWAGSSDRRRRRSAFKDFSHLGKCQ